MEKRIWTMPQAEVEKFEMNAYCASACGTENLVYKFQCDAPAGSLYGPSFWGGMSYRGPFTPCPANHEAPTTDEFEDGFIDYNKNGKQDDGEAVIIWDYEHATKEVDMETWETAKS